MKNWLIIIFSFVILIGCKEKEGAYLPISSSSFVKMYGKSKIDNAFDFKQTSDDGYILVGSVTDHYSTETGALGDKQFYIVKIDKFGNKQWELFLGDSSVFDTLNNVAIPLDDEARSVQITSDGNYIVAGTKMFFTLGTSNELKTYTNMYLVKIDPNGNILSENDRIGYFDINDRGNGVVEISDGYIVLGSTENEELNNNNLKGQKDGLLARCNFDLQLVDSLRQSGYSGDQEFFKGISTSFSGDENIILLGENKTLSGEGVNIWLVPYSISDLQNPGSSKDKLNVEYDDFAGTIILANNELVMINTDGTSTGGKSWISSFELSKDLETTSLNAFIETPNANTLGNSICQTHQKDGFITLNTKDVSGDKSIFTQFITNEGVIDEEKFNTSYGDVSLEEGISIIPTNDGGYAILGNARFGSDQKLVLIKIDENGELK